MNRPKNAGRLLLLGLLAWVPLTVLAIAPPQFKIWYGEAPLLASQAGLSSIKIEAYSTPQRDGPPDAVLTITPTAGAYPQVCTASVTSGQLYDGFPYWFFAYLDVNTTGSFDPTSDPCGYAVYQPINQPIGVGWGRAPVEINLQQNAIGFPRFQWNLNGHSVSRVQVDYMFKSGGVMNYINVADLTLRAPRNYVTEADLVQLGKTNGMGTPTKTADWTPQYRWSVMLDPSGPAPVPYAPSTPYTTFAQNWTADSLAQPTIVFPLNEVEHMDRPLRCEWIASDNVAAFTLEIRQGGSTGPVIMNSAVRAPYYIGSGGSVHYVYNPPADALRQLPDGSYSWRVAPNNNPSLGGATFSAWSQFRLVTRSFRSSPAFSDYIPAWWKVQYGLDQAMYDSLGLLRYDLQDDMDSDGWSNLSEYMGGTSPIDVTKYPQPPLEATIWYSGPNSPPSGNIKIAAYSTPLMDGEPDAIFTANPAKGLQYFGTVVTASNTVAGSRLIWLTSPVNIIGCTLQGLGLAANTVVTNMVANGSGFGIVAINPPTTAEITNGTVLTVFTPVAANAPYPKTFILTNVVGHLREGDNWFFAYIDHLVLNNRFDASEPCGYAVYHQPINVGWSTVPLEINLQPQAIGFPRFQWALGSTTRVSRVQVDYAYMSGGITNYINVADLTLRAPRNYFTEADLVYLGKTNGMGTPTKTTDWTPQYRWSVMLDPSGPNPVTYVPGSAAANSPYTAFSQTWSADSFTQPTLVSPASNAVVQLMPLRCEWTASGNVAAFTLEIRKASPTGTVMMSSTVRAPYFIGRAGSFHYVYEPQYAPSQFLMLPDGVYYWRVTPNNNPALSGATPSVWSPFTIATVDDPASSPFSISGDLVYTGALTNNTKAYPFLVQAYSVLDVPGFSGKPVAQTILFQPGMFRLTGLKSGTYTLLGFIDQNGDGRLNGSETWGFINNAVPGFGSGINGCWQIGTLAVTSSIPYVAGSTVVTLLDRDSDNDGVSDALEIENYGALMPSTVSISGKVTKSGTTNGVPAVTISFSGGYGSTTTDGSGNYTMYVSNKWSGTATASFSPSNGLFASPTKTFSSVTVNLSGQNFVWTPPPMISGKVTKSGTSTGVAGVQMVFTSGGGTVTTDANGNYSNVVIYGWSGTVTPQTNGLGGAFSPITKSYSKLKANSSSQNYTWIPPPMISGKITKSGTSTGVTNVTVTASNGGGTTNTDANGNYTLTVPYNWTGVVTPSTTNGGTFSPASKSFTSKVTANKTGQNFTWTTPASAARPVALIGSPAIAAGVMAPVGFAQWALLHGLDGSVPDLFDQNADGVGVTYGAEYAFGANLAPGAPVLQLLTVNGILTAEVPLQDPATAMDAKVTVNASLSAGSGNWNLAVPVPTPMPNGATKQWYQALYGNAAEFRVTVQQIQ